MLSTGEMSDGIRTRIAQLFDDLYHYPEVNKDIVRRYLLLSAKWAHKYADANLVPYISKKSRELAERLREILPETKYGRY